MKANPKLIIAFISVWSPSFANAGDGVLDLTQLANYANQAVPSYITKNNTTAGNPITDKGATLGRVLFHDKRLSRDNTISCSSCHDQSRAFGDSPTASTGVNGTTGRHAMRLINAPFANEVRFFWDERATTLENQTTQPVRDHVEMGFSGTSGDPAFADLVANIVQTEEQFVVAPGEPGLVMSVFTLPSFEFVFKLIKDKEFYPPQKDTTREIIQSKYQLVKQHDRVGRMADTLEYSGVGFPLQRFEPELLAEIEKFAPSQLQVNTRSDGTQEVIIAHVYIERRMIPLNIYLQEAFDAGGADPTATSPAAVQARVQIERGVAEYGNAIKDLVAANIFPGDMLWKNFGVMRHGKVVFYDYDEIEYITDCNFRKVPAPRNEEDEMSGEIWYHVGPRDVFPETFGPFLLGNPAVRSVFMKHHSDLLDASFWQGHKEKISQGHVHDVFPYEADKRFAVQRLTYSPD